MRTIVAVHKLEERHLRRIREAAPGWTVIDGSDKAALEEHLPDAEIVFGWNRSVRDLVGNGSSKLRWVQYWGAGVDRLPLQKLQQLGVVLTNASGVHPYPIAETIFAMLLSFTRHLNLSLRNQAERKWETTGTLGEAHGRTIGILGVGAVGLETARLAKAFNMNVLGIRRSGEPAQWVDQMYTLEGIHEVLGSSDYIINCLPHTRETEHIMGREQFEAMKPSAYYINIGRGKTTDTDALVDALQNGQISGAGLDVFESEPLAPEHPLWAMENVILTPHIAGDTTVYEERIAGIFLENLSLYLQSGQPSLNVVDLQKEY
ncbi:Glyoxylate/hydroxypyruvate reductase B [Paenibacillus plantiphilus]|uniref:Glyoxylate/hydroxypyruvate reductase B n=1 Tax=Paenibacillus plantiphilus TaxID=2905650 RepID=A0ABM9CSK4_9BACL|nr:D-2-hydroxyacid dehydrogenase [Paenibacillus plantiphilus]CAH1221026.1 Glyoxylate/hydroxypyruvate reductase B [Paenibacillus plantiphilus]